VRARRCATREYARALTFPTSVHTIAYLHEATAAAHLRREIKRKLFGFFFGFPRTRQVGNFFIGPAECRAIIIIQTGDKASVLLLLLLLQVRGVRPADEPE